MVASISGAAIEGGRFLNQDDDRLFGFALFVTCVTKRLCALADQLLK